jgi:hypothetical protein
MKSLMTAVVKHTVEMFVKLEVAERTFYHGFGLIQGRRNDQNPTLSIVRHEMIVCRRCSLNIPLGLIATIYVHLQ